jgi:gamma-glutamyltranspeptidase / glutathione hydrolase
VSRAFDRPGRSPVVAENGLAATSHPLATQTAISVLKAGGNAVDAAIAASATLCVVEPAMTGIGGDCFAIVAEPDGSIHGLNGSGRAASRVDAGWYRANGFAEIPETGPHAVTVPGAARRGRHCSAASARAASAHCSPTRSVMPKTASRSTSGSHGTGRAMSPTSW